MSINCLQDAKIAFTNINAYELYPIVMFTSFKPGEVVISPAAPTAAPTANPTPTANQTHTYSVTLTTPIYTTVINSTVTPTPAISALTTPFQASFLHPQPHFYSHVSISTPVTPFPSAPPHFHAYDTINPPRPRFFKVRMSELLVWDKVRKVEPGCGYCAPNSTIRVVGISNLLTALFATPDCDG